MLNNCWLIIVLRLTTIQNVCHDVLLTNLPFANKSDAKSGPIVCCPESYSDKLQVRGISAPIIFQPNVNPIARSPTISQRFSQINNDGPTNCATWKELLRRFHVCTAPDIMQTAPLEESTEQVLPKASSSF